MYSGVTLDCLDLASMTVHAAPNLELRESVLLVLTSSEQGQLGTLKWSHPGYQCDLEYRSQNTACSQQSKPAHNARLEQYKHIMLSWSKTWQIRGNQDN